MNISCSMISDLAILCFRENQMALDDFNSSATGPVMPILCLTKTGDIEKLSWAENSIVFTYPVEQTGQSAYLNSMINSILSLRNENISVTKRAGILKYQKDTQSRKNRDMSKVVLELDQKVDVLKKVKERIANLYNRVDDPIRAELNHIVNSIKNSVTDNKLWEDFKLYFVKTNPNFLLLLAKKYPALTQIDLKYCCYLKMNMANDDIRALLGINQESVRTHKYRLKKKLALGKEQSLRTYLQSVN
jgi:DNA-binding CsgD family transcriptional regulator